jgi:hypothetical protein
MVLIGACTCNLPCQTVLPHLQSGMAKHKHSCPSYLLGCEGRGALRQLGQLGDDVGKGQAGGAGLILNHAQDGNGNL